MTTISSSEVYSLQYPKNGGGSPYFPRTNKFEIKHSHLYSFGIQLCRLLSCSTVSGHDHPLAGPYRVWLVNAQSLASPPPPPPPPPPLTVVCELIASTTSNFNQYFYTVSLKLDTRLFYELFESLRYHEASTSTKLCSHKLID